MRLIAELEHGLDRRTQQGLLRARRVLSSPQGPRVVVDGRRMLAFASNDYLGLADDPRIIEAMRGALLQWGAGAGASHLVSGHFAPHAALEAALAAYVAPCAQAKALLFSTGYLANLAILTALAGREDAIFADRLNHACLNDGALLSRARLLRYPHLDMAVLEQHLVRTSARRKFIATDAVFSMEGDIAPLRTLLTLAERFDAMLVVDDAHGFGVLGEGRGTAAHLGISSDRLVLMGTLGKAAGVAGAFVAAHPAVIETLLQTARSYVYTTASPPALAAGLLESLAIIRGADAQRSRLAELTTRFSAGAAGLPWQHRPSPTAIQPLVIGDNRAALALADALWRRGIWIPAIRPPTVPDGTSRLRVSLSAAHTNADIDQLMNALHDSARELSAMAACA
ncbi:MAG: 8-amino-7-oxononanoate synthase [Pseudomonadota bacterium]|nr:8-amino-7-oxononanoate synthase [Pseudomonadota bacterium]